jgi:hypothetical protein
MLQAAACGAGRLPPPEHCYYLSMLMVVLEYFPIPFTVQHILQLSAHEVITGSSRRQCVFSVL